jgi:hypothetical protein
MSREEMMNGLFSVKTQYGVPEAKKIIVTFGCAEKANDIADDRIKAVIDACKARMEKLVEAFLNTAAGLPTGVPMPPTPTGSMPATAIIEPDTMRKLIEQQRERQLIADMRKRGNELLPINHRLGAMMISCAYHLEELMKEQPK